MANAGKTSNSSSETDEKKRKRKLSNRESARRSRLKKRKLMEETIHEISILERRIKENIERCKVMKQRLDSVELENDVLRSEKIWLSRCVCDLENMINEENENAELIAVGDCRRRRELRLSCDSLQPITSFKT